MVVTLTPQTNKRKLHLYTTLIHILIVSRDVHILTLFLYSIPPVQSHLSHMYQTGIRHSSHTHSIPF